MPQVALRGTPGRAPASDPRLVDVGAKYGPGMHTDRDWWRIAALLMSVAACTVRIGAGLASGEAFGVTPTALAAIIALSLLLVCSEIVAPMG